jgi:hypothetical protein
MSAAAYLERVASMLEQLRTEQLGRIEEAAGLVADALRNDAIVHIFGTGHSHLLAEEALYRAGGLAAVNAILDPGLMLRDGALAPKISLLVIPGCDVLALAESVRRLTSVRPAALLPGHGPFPLRGAHDHVERAHRAFESMLPPPQILQ